MAVTEFDRITRARREPGSPALRKLFHSCDGSTVGAVLLCGWVWGVFVFLGWGLLHASHL